MNMRTGLLVIATLALSLPLLTRGAEQGSHSKGAVRAAKSFIRGVVQEDRDLIRESFDFSTAYDDISRKLDLAGVPNPWDRGEIRRTIMHWFLKDENQREIAELSGDDVHVSQEVHPKHPVARVTITKDDVKKDAEFGKTTHVDMRKTDSGWKVVTFPEFYPLDAWEILTGVEATR